MRLVYFARVREAVGTDEEMCDLPESVMTIAQCLDWLEGRDPKYISAFGDRNQLRFALDQSMVSADAAILDTSELAIFPPVTGG